MRGPRLSIRYQLGLKIQFDKERFMSMMSSKQRHPLGIPGDIGGDLAVGSGPAGQDDSKLIQYNEMSVENPNSIS